jgi:hypothetical protein
MSESPQGFFDRLKHAFHVEEPGEAKPDEKTAETVQKICREIVRREMVVPALMLLEMSRPLNFLGAQALHFFQPFGTVLIDPGAWEGFANFLEQRGSVEYLIQQLEDANTDERGRKDTQDTSEGSPEVNDASKE